MFTDFTRWQLAIENFLLDWLPLWRPEPFKVAQPDWVETYPSLAADLLELTDAEVDRLSGEPRALGDYLATYIPPLAAIGALTTVTPSSASRHPLPVAHHTRDIPGRKLAQIRSFLGAAGTLTHPVLEWCAGKGHLGRVLATTTPLEVVSLERDAALCKAGAALARRADAKRQRFVTLDALEAPAAALLDGRCTLALHACGDLHRTLVHHALTHAVPALHIAPCCYHKMRAPELRSLTGEAQLTLSRAELRFAVSDTATASAAEVRLKQRAAAWKLGYRELALAHALPGTKPATHGVPAHWLRGDFAAFCRVAAARDGWLLPAQLDWQRAELAGWARFATVRRFDLVRQGFRRLIELWVLLDLASALEQAGYRVAVKTWCARHITPRNLMISAQR